MTSQGSGTSRRRLFGVADRLGRAVLRLPTRADATYVAPWEASARDDVALRRPVLLVARLLRLRVWLRTRRWLPWFALRDGVTVVIVSWQSAGLLPTTIAAVRRYSPPDTEILVVDNASTDGTRDQLRDLVRRGEVRTVVLPTNLFHGPAMDLGFLLARTKTVVALDVDAFPIASSWLDTLTAPLLDPSSEVLVTGATAARGYIHPCCLAIGLARFASERHSFTPHAMGDGSLPLLDDDWSGRDASRRRWDTGESISRREGPDACLGLPRTSVHGPAQLGSVFGEVVFHNGASTRIPAGEVVAGITAEDVWASWHDAVASHVPADGATPPDHPDHGTAELAVVIAARDAASTIGAQLGALLDQEAPHHRCEIVVVDNGSVDGTDDVVQRAAEADPRVRLVRARDHDGAGYARNVGVASTAARSIAFCDADDVVAAGWLPAMSEALHNHRFVSGPTEVERLNPPWIVESRGRAHTRELTTFEGIFPFASSCNFGVDRIAFDAVGGFDETFRIGQDIELSLRLWQAGVDLHFEPEALVHYRYPATLTDSFRRARRYGAVRPRIGEELRDIGSATPRRLTGARNWLWLVRHLGLLGNEAGRARWLWVAGQRIGNLEGSLAARKLYL